MIVCADARALPLRDECVQCCVTSPPYWGLRRYNGHDGEIGMEERLEDYLAAICATMREVWRALRPDGTLWLNLGDSYVSTGEAIVTPQNGEQFATRRRGREAICQSRRFRRVPSECISLKPKDLCGVPWRVAFALQAEGWYLRQEIVWEKPAPMPESVRDRCTRSHEYIFLLAKSRRYFFDREAISEPVSGTAHARMSREDLARRIKTPVAGWADCGDHSAAGWARAKNGGQGAGKFRKRATAGSGIRYNESFAEATKLPVGRRNARSVWRFCSAGFSGAHFATFPLELARRCILAGSRPGDIVLDPFAGSGTTGEAALKLGRQPVLVDLGYQDLQRERLGLWASAPVARSLRSALNGDDRREALADSLNAAPGEQ